MGTRGIIARIDEKRGFAGNYHHWDSYPTQLGATLWKLYHGHFECNLKVMLRVLIDDHPAGWSTINDADFTLEPGWSNTDLGQINPVCYCHGDRHKEGHVIYPEDDYGAEWVYVFDEEKNTMAVLMAVDKAGEHVIGFFGTNPGRQNWRVIANFSLDGEEPDWKALNFFAYEGE